MRDRRDGGGVVLAALLLAVLVQSPGALAQGLGSLRAPARGDPSSAKWHPLAIEVVEVDVRVTGRFARTEVRQVFRNNDSWQTEGIYRFELPPGAAIVRLAMDVNGKMMEGELVERTRARKVYDEIVGTRRDPALLEHRGGNRYEMSIFPIAARGTKTVVMVYEQLANEVNGQVHYHYALPRIRGTRGPGIGRFQFDLTADGLVRKRLARKRFYPKGPIDVRWARTRSAGPQVYYGKRGPDTVFYADLTTKLNPSDAKLRDVVIAMDTSSSLGPRELRRSVQIASDLLRALPKDVRVNVVYGDYVADKCSNAAAPTRATLRRCLKKLTSRGATNFVGLLGQAHAVARGFGRPAAIVLLSDGLVTVGVREAKALSQRLAAMLRPGDVTLHTVAVGAGRDETLLASLARVGRGLHHDQSTGTAARIVAGMRGAMLSDVKVKVTAGEVRKLTPRVRGNVASGEPLVVMGVLASPSASLVVRAGQGASRFSARVELSKPRSGIALTAPVLSFWARSLIADRVRAKAKPEEIVKLSLLHGVMSPFTAYLVLEKAADYERYGITRRKGHLNANSLGTIEGRRAANIVKRRSGTGSLKVMTRRRAARPPQVRIGHVYATGDLDKNLIRGPIREQIPRIRACYQRELRHDPQLAGTVVTQFVILPSGEIKVAVANGVNAELSACVRAAIMRIRFPAPKGGGLINVRYPFVFEPVTTKKPKRNDPAKRIVQLQARGTALSIGEQGELIALYLKLGDTAKAEALYHSARRLLAPGGAPTKQLLWLLTSNIARVHFGADFRAAAAARLAMPNPPDALVDQLFRSTVAAEPAAIVKKFARSTPPVSMAAGWMDLLFEKGHGTRARELFSRFERGKQYSLRQLYQMLSGSRVQGPMGIKRFAILGKLVAAGRADMDDYVKSGVALGRVAQAATTVLRKCRKPADIDGACARWLRALSADRRAKTRVRSLARRRLAEVLKERRVSEDKNILLEEEARALIALGRLHEGLRALSVAVEKDPDDSYAYGSIGWTLLDLGHTKLGCQALAEAYRMHKVSNFIDDRCPELL